jgi:prolipoprotein diacylglyceryl transferase
MLFVSGLILSIYILKKVFIKDDISAGNFEKLTIYGLIGIFAGARFGHCLFYEPSYYLTHPLEMLLPIQPTPEGGYTFSGYQGLASHGGAIGLLIALIVYSFKTKENTIKLLDWVGVITPLAGCFIRLANLMNSEIIGIPTTLPWGFIFAREDNLPRHPAQLYEAIAYLLIFGVNYFLYKIKSGKLKPGFFFGLSVALIFTARFLIEFVKERQVPFEEQMSLGMGQLLSLPFIVLGTGFMASGYFINRRR